ncbi:MAG: phosphate acyltransferase PlsX [Dehalococcoidia bacterium]|nr:phosphate acyltransferase PlsX [Dehalococcoidia bacterium]
MSEPRVVVDAMGGDKAPFDVVKGAVEASRELGIEVILTGPKSVMDGELAKHNTSGTKLRVVDAPSVVGMTEHPGQALRQKQDSSIGIGINMVKSGEADAFVSAGNSGAVGAFALLNLKMMENVERPALALLFRGTKGVGLFLDSGATSDCKPDYYVDWAVVGSLYMTKVMGIANPKVALLSIGEEDGKGTKEVIEANKLLREEKSINFIGNIEGKDILKGMADVIVTDGFTGNVVLKFTEGFAEALFGSIRHALLSGIKTKVGALLVKPSLVKVAEYWDYRKYGGALLLGVKGNVIICHGRSDSLAIKSAISMAKRTAEGKMFAEIVEAKI